MSVTFVGLGWMVSRHGEMLMKVVGAERASNIYEGYRKASAEIMPLDSDGDGVCDGLEILNKTDPQNPTSHQSICPDWAESTSTYCGERISTRWIGSDNGWPQRWPKGFRAIITAGAPVLLAKGSAEPPTAGPLTATANANGEIEFDVLANEAYGDVPVVFTNVRTMESFPTPFLWFPGWRKPSVPAKWEPATADWKTGHPDWKLPGDEAPRTLAWKSADNVSGYVIEAKSLSPRFHHWIPVWHALLDTTECPSWKLGQQLVAAPSAGWNFRIIPVVATPP